MEEPKKITQIVFLGNHLDRADRVKHLLRRFIPHKIYFIRKMEDLGIAERDIQEEMKKEYEKELPKWVADGSEEIEISHYNFEAAFPIILKILLKEKKEGNEVYIILHGAGHLVGVATAMAASMTGAKMWVVKPKRYEVVAEKIIRSVGAADSVEIKFPFVPLLPKKEDASILTFLLKNNNSFKGKLRDLVADVGLEKLGANIKKPNSGIVKASKILGKLREDGCVTTKKISRKTFQISLTERGKLMAEISQLMV